MFTTKYDAYFNINKVSDNLPIQLIMKLDMSQLASTIPKLICWSNVNYTDNNVIKVIKIYCWTKLRYQI